jgi:hypothetical protein
MMKYQSIFPDQNIGMPGIQGFEYQVHGDTAPKPICRRMRPYNVQEKAVIRMHVNDMLQNGIISECQSPWGFIPVLAAKLDGTWRFASSLSRLMM